MYHCRHCRSPLSRPRGAGRGLCWTCYREPAVFVAYGTLPKGPDRESRRRLEVEPTETELAAIIAEQMARLPDWWAGECDREPRVYVVVKCR